METLSTLLNDHQHYHSTLQCRQFITAKAGVTVFGMYRQTLRELDSRTWSTFEDLLSREELLCTLDELEEKLETCEDDARTRRLALRRVKAQIRLEQTERLLRDRYREWAEFYGQAVRLRRELGLEEGEQLTPQRREQLEVTMFAGQFASTIRAGLLAGVGEPVSANTMEAILTLPREAREPFKFVRSDPNAFLQFCAQVLPDPGLPQPDDIPALPAVEAMILDRFEAMGAPRMEGLLLE